MMFLWESYLESSGIWSQVFGFLVFVCLFLCWCLSSLGKLVRISATFLCFDHNYFEQWHCHCSKCFSTWLQEPLDCHCWYNPSGASRTFFHNSTHSLGSYYTKKRFCIQTNLGNCRRKSNVYIFLCQDFSEYFIVSVPCDLGRGLFEASSWWMFCGTHFEEWYFLVTPHIS